MKDSKRQRDAQRASYKRNVKKLQDAGLLGKVDIRKHATPAVKRALDKYRGLLVGHETAVQADTVKQARELRRKFGLKGTGKTVIVPREKGERVRLTKKGELTSTRPNPVQPNTKIKKTYGEKLAPERTGNEKLYYTLPERKRGLGRIKRTTFASFDEMLFYLHQYEINFEDIEDFIEIEEVLPTSRKAKRLDKKISEERAARYAAAKRRRKKKTAKKTKAHKPRRNDAKANRLKSRKR